MIVNGVQIEKLLACAATEYVTYQGFDRKKLPREL